MIEKLFGVIVAIVLTIMAVSILLMTAEMLMNLGPIWALIAVGLGGVIWMKVSSAKN